MYTSLLLCDWKRLHKRWLDMSSILLSFFDLNRFGGMSNCITDKMGQKLLETAHYWRVEIVFDLLLFSFTVMGPVATSKRSHLSTGRTPNKPREERPTEGINRKIRGPLSFSSENVPCNLRVSPPEDHAGKSTVHITDSLETWHTCRTSLAH